MGIRNKIHKRIDDEAKTHGWSDQKRDDMKKAVTNAIDFDPLWTTSYQAIIASTETNIQREIYQSKKEMAEKGDLHLPGNGMPGMPTPGSKKYVSKASSGFGSIASGIEKLVNADSDPMQIVSGVVDFASAAAQFLPPPISLIGDAAVGFLGIFFPGLSGPSNQEVIDKLTEEIQEGFKEQRKFISQGFDIQQKLIK